MDQLVNVNEYKAVAAELIDLGVAYGLNLLTAVILLVLGLVIARWASRAVRHRLKKIDRFDRALIPIVEQIVRYSVIVFTVILVLAEFGIQTTSIIAVLGAAGLAIGLALQGTLQNVAAGFMLLFIRPFTAGDFVETAAGSGTVDEIGLFMTKMRTPQGVFMAIPNSMLWSDAITNYSRLPTRRIEVIIGVSYEDDIDEARDIILKLAKDDERVSADPEPIVVVKNLGESSVDLELRAWSKREDYWDTQWDLIRKVKYALDKAGISIPYPHRKIISAPG